MSVCMCVLFWTVTYVTQPDMCMKIQTVSNGHVHKQTKGLTEQVWTYTRPWLSLSRV